MRLSSLLGSAFLLGAGFVAASDVIDLTGDDFDSVVKEKDLMLVEFFAPWCGHCKALAPHYEEAATTLKDKGISIAKVDCVDQAELCSTHGVTGYPTLKVFRKGVATDYQGPRKADGIVAYMVKQSLPAVSEVTATNHEEFTKSDKVVVIAYVSAAGDAPAPVFSAVANQHRDDYLFGLTTDAAAIKAAKVTPPAIVMYKKFDEGRNDFPSEDIVDTSAKTLEAFIKDRALPLIDEVGGENYQYYADSGLPLAYLFLDPTDDQKQTHIEAIIPVAKKYKGKVNFVWIDALKYSDHGRALALMQAKWPAFVIQDIQKQAKFPLDQETTTSFASVDEFVGKYVAGEIQPTLKSEPVPLKNDDPVFTIVGSQFKEIALDKSKDVFVEFYAPWCGHCKRLAPAWESLATRYSSIKDKILIAKMDATENDLPLDTPFQIAGFPTLKLKPAGSDEWVDYEGDRSIESLIEFVEKHAKNDVTVEVPPEEPKTEEAQTVVTDSTPEAEKPRDEL